MMLLLFAFIRSYDGQHDGLVEGHSHSQYNFGFLDYFAVIIDFAYGSTLANFSRCPGIPLKFELRRRLYNIFSALRVHM